MNPKIKFNFNQFLWCHNSCCHYHHLPNFFCMKHIMLCKCLLSFCSCFSARCIWDNGIVNQYMWFWKSLNLVDQSYEFSFFWDIHVRINERIYISISIRPMKTKFGKQLHLEELTQVRLMKQVLVMSPGQNHVTNENHISTTRVPMATKLCRMVTYLDWLLPLKLHDPLIMWSWEIM